MKLHVLPVRVGDAFFVVGKGFRAIIDGGQDRSDVVKLVDLKGLRRKHINLIVCTHYDADHINGILGLLKNGYSFDEIWLPELFGSICLTISKKLQELQTFFRDDVREKHAFRESIPDYESELSSEANDNSYEQIDVELIEERGYGVYRHSIMWRFQMMTPKMMLNLGKICAFTASVVKSGSHIRWFKYLPRLTNASVAFGLRPQNCAQVRIVPYTPQLFLSMLYLTTINRHSLVYKLETNGQPDILFTADSDLSFAPGGIALRDNSIVTAPHHGSKENDNAYSLIHGKNPLFVRSDRSQVSRPGSGYLAQKRKYCTICRNRGPKQEIIVELARNSSQILVGKKCKC